ncbi:Arc family DNA-binding protein [Methylobacterium sp. J-090]|uniref:Arc family DNA-binding protein n=1 Tax=Methylobacterium sp. J-090 TaxID=2836666 RepID=UPI001FB8DC1C|nr:Arc family DNA-binding protein [Methylobacterium sp. J-090]MCJ2081422.1 Arc family DNA-binding protein [Methylobacterium sp. J-090]
MAQDSESRSLDKTVIRVPEGMRDRIAAAARSNGRSTNAEIVQLLEMHYPPADEVADLIAGIFRMSNENPPKEQ